MRKLALLIVLTFLISCTNKTKLQVSTGVETITPKGLKLHLDFLASDDMRGRDTPSNELNIAASYLSLYSKSYGLKPLMPNGSFYQNLPLHSAKVDTDKTTMTVNGKSKFEFQKDFGFKPGMIEDGKISGDIVFLGYGLQAPDASWDDVKGFDIKGKVVLLMEVTLPDNHNLIKNVGWRSRRYRAKELISKGASAVLTIVSLKDENGLTEKGISFDNSLQSKYIENVTDNNTSKTNAKSSYILEVRHKMASELLNISQNELGQLFKQIKAGKRVKGRVLKNKFVNLKVKTIQKKTNARNVLAYIEGSDPNLRDEFVIFSAHYDHVGVIKGEVYNGSNDNGSGTVALLGVAKAMAKQKPKRSVIFAWFSGEEKGIWGSKEFIKNPPIPIEKISANINLDVCQGYDISKLTTIGGRKLSSEIAKSMMSINEKYFSINFDYKYDNTSSSIFFSSDHSTFMKRGIPSVWLSSEAEPNRVHVPEDSPDKATGTKLTLITKFSYYLALDFANKEQMLPLDLNPKITKRGNHNLRFNWTKEKE